MSERVEWLDDDTASGAPFSPRFQDRYRSELGGISQARDVFLAGCGLPAAWQNQAQWRILETGFGLGLNFLVTWSAWLADSQRPRILHFVSTEAFPASADDVLRSASAHPELMPLAKQLHTQLWGLLPGLHRLVFENGHVLLTLCIGDAKTMLRQQQLEVDSVYLDGFSPQKNPDIWDIHTFKTVARCCRRGTRIATWTVARQVRDALAQAGFVVKKTPGIPPKRDNLQGQYNPAWEPKKPAATVTGTAISALPVSNCVVIGAGLAGAAVAASLARRGWQVTVLDAATEAASGASGLPAGVMAPHVSPDDSLLSRLSRSGIRISLQQAETLLTAGQDWAPTGVLEVDVNNSQRSLPQAWADSHWQNAADQWSQTATAEHLASANLPQTTQALWHSRAGWVKPASLVKAWLATAGVLWQGNSRVAHMTPTEQGWQLSDQQGEVLAKAKLVVVAAACESLAIIGAMASSLKLQPVRGQVSWGWHESAAGSASPKNMPDVPINGHGSLIPAVPLQQGMAWLMGSSFERDVNSPDIRPQDELENLKKLQTLHPAAANRLQQQFESGEVKAWSGVRCATPGRLPVLGRLASDGLAGEVWVCTGMGSRGLSFASLCAELLAAQLHAEPLPLEQRLVKALMLNPVKPGSESFPAEV